VKAPVDPYRGLARIYRSLEYLAFGRDLERARFTFLDQLRECESILILGEGDGRCLARLIKIAPRARIQCVDRSVAMLERAARRLSSDTDRRRVTFREADALENDFSAEHYDAVLTLFFLDCFSPENVEILVQHLLPRLTPRAKWLFADFDIPENRGAFAKVRARFWLVILITFFRWQTQHAPKSLPPSEAILRRAGLALVAEKTFQFGLVRSAVFSQPGSRT